MIPKCTDQDFLWYWYGKYQEILADTNRKIPIRYTTLVSLYYKLAVGFTSLLLNSARYIMLFQNFVVLWKIRMSQNIILPADASHQDASNGIRVAYVHFYNM